METETEADIERRISDASAALSGMISEINADAARTIAEVVRDAEAERDALLRRLVNIRVGRLMDVPAFGTTKVPLGTPAVASVPPSTAERRSARSIALGLLAGALSPVSGNEIDAAIIREGWTKAASEKIKQKLRIAGLARSDKRHWTITEEGRRAMSE